MFMIFLIYNNQTIEKHKMKYKIKFKIFSLENNILVETYI